MSNFPLIRQRGSHSEFIFATGCECSYPTIEWEGKHVRRDDTTYRNTTIIGRVILIW